MIKDYFLATTKSCVPHAALQDFVLSITAIDLRLPSGTLSSVSPYPPTPLQSIIFYLGHPIQMQRIGETTFTKQPTIVIVGPQYTRVNIMVTNGLEAIRVDFKPGGLYRLLGIPMSELFDQGIGADALLGNAVTMLNERLLNSADANESIRLIERFLLSKVASQRTPIPFEHAIKKLIESDGSLSIQETACLACLSVRQFERVCLERVGMSPKSFLRIVRFSKAYRLRESQPHLSWISIAHDSGYFDQMHLIKDFKQFAGTTPSLIDKTLGNTPLRMQATIL